MKVHSKLSEEVKSCALCKDYLPFSPRPIFQFHPSARVLIAGQAPGQKAHSSGIPFDDASGERLREWMGISKDVFYDCEQVAILPMGFCYPGKGKGKSGDLPPRKECEPKWRELLMSQLSMVEITLVLGKYAQTYHFGETCSSLTELVRSWRDYWPTVVPLPHPSPRNNIWLRKNPWFENELVPSLQEAIHSVLSHR